MDSNLRTRGLLALLAVATLGVAYSQWPRSGASGVGVRGAQGGSKRAADGAVPSAPDVRLEALTAARPSPSEAARNLFAFKAKVVPPSVPIQTRPRPDDAGIVPPSPPPVPPIALKFIGVLEPIGAARIAVLTDGLGAPIYGKEGDTVLGRYRILRIGAESIEMDHLDGRGRQMIRLSGS